MLSKVEEILKFDPKTPVIVYYHGNCADGFTAAWVAYKWLQKYATNVEYVPVQYNEPWPRENLNKIVFVLDYCALPGLMENLIEEALYTVVLDHHAGAIDKMTGTGLFQPNAAGIDCESEDHYFIFRTTKSGAGLAYDYFFAGNSMGMRLIVYHTQQRDLWKKDSPDWITTRQVAANMFSYEYTFENWDEINEALGTGPMVMLTEEVAARQQFIKAGEAIERKHFKDCNELIKTFWNTIKINDVEVPFINAPYIHSSDIGDILGKDWPFVVCYWIQQNSTGMQQVVYSLRSQPRPILADESVVQFDVNLLAQQFQGGGHKGAAGFKTPIEELYLGLVHGKINSIPYLTKLESNGKS